MMCPTCVRGRERVLGVIQGGGGMRNPHVAMPVPWASITG